MTYAMSAQSLFSKFYYYLLLLVSFSLPFPRSFNNVAVILLGLTCIVSGNYRVKWAKLRSHILPWLFIGIFILYILGLIHTDNYSDAFFKLEKSIPILLLPLIFFSSPSLTKKQFENILRSFLAGVFIISIVAVVTAFFKRYYLQNLSEVELNNFYIDLPHLFMHHIYYGYYLLVSIFIAGYFIFNNKSSDRQRIVYGLLAFLLTILLVFTSGLMAFVVLAIVSTLGILKFLLSRIKSPVPVILLCFAVLIFTIPAYNFVENSNSKTVLRYKQRINLSFHDIENNKYNYSSTRVGPLKTGLAVAKEHWLLGVGTGDTNDKMKDKYLLAGLDQLVEFNTHNQYLDYLITFGIIGLIVLVLCLAYPLYLSLKLNLYLYTCFILLIGISLLSENLLSANKGIVLYAFMNSLLASYMLSNQKSKI